MFCKVKYIVSEIKIFSLLTYLFIRYSQSQQSSFKNMRLNIVQLFYRAMQIIVCTC